MIFWLLKTENPKIITSLFRFRCLLKLITEVDWLENYVVGFLVKSSDFNINHSWALTLAIEMSFMTNQMLGHLLQAFNSSNTVQLYRSKMLSKEVKLFDKRGPKSLDVKCSVKVSVHSSKSNWWNSQITFLESSKLSL